MKLLVKTLKGEKFHVDCEGSNSVAEVKGIIVSGGEVGLVTLAVGLLRRGVRVGA